jgi:carbon starvation protein
MTVLLVMVVSSAFLFGAGRLYSGYISRKLGMDPTRPTPAITMADGRDYVATPTPVVFAHHFASIAGAGPIVGPVIAVIYGWLPALLWVLLGGVLIGAVHDYLATYMATREGGQSVATIVRRMVGTGPFLAITVMIVVMLALVCAAFLNLSATALTSKLPFDRLDLPRAQTLFRVVPTDTRDVIGQPGKLGDKDVMVRRQVIDGMPYVLYNELKGAKEVTVAKAKILTTEQRDGQEVVTGKEPELVVIGGIASMSVVCITIVAPLVGWLYIKKLVAVWKCSLLAIAVCATSIAFGVYRPIALDELTWKLALSAYVLVAAGVPVWIFLQSRDFINVHILYVGMAALVVTLVVAGIRGADAGGLKEGAELIPALNIAEGNKANGFFWPGLFILIACGAVSGFHSLCAGGTTCKQLTSEKATRQIGYYAMLLESFLAACVIAVFVVGAVKADYISDVHPVKLLGLAKDSNPVLGFAMAVGNTAKLAFGVPIAFGALAGMVLLEGFLVTTLDTAVRLTRYLIEEVWRTVFARYDVFAEPVAMRDQAGDGVAMPIGAGGLPASPSAADQPAAPGKPIATRGFFRGLCLVLRQYWFNSGLAVALMLAFAMTGGMKALWAIFATSNQLLAALVLSIASLWLLRQGRSFWFALVPAAAMLVTTLTSLCLEIAKLIPKLTTNPGESLPLLIAEGVILCITAYLLTAGIAEAIRFVRARRRAAAAAAV